MKKSEIDRMAEREREYWWHLGRNRIVQKQLELLFRKKKGSLKILNVGAGTGGTISAMSSFGDVHNVELSKSAVAYMEEQGIDNVVLGDATDMDFKDGEFDLVIALDVLEHIDEESKALKEWRRVMKDDGRLLISVPAYAWLWSKHDEALNHFRRYSYSSMQNATRVAGFRSVFTSYMFVFTLPLVVAYRVFVQPFTSVEQKQSSYVEVPAFINRLFTFILNIEATLLTKLRLPFGTSVLFVGKKE